MCTHYNWGQKKQAVIILKDANIPEKFIIGIIIFYFSKHINLTNEALHDKDTTDLSILATNPLPTQIHPCYM